MKWQVHKSDHQGPKGRGRKKTNDLVASRRKLHKHWKKTKELGGGGIKMEQILVLEGKYCKVKKSKPLQESLLIFTGLLLNVKGNIFSSVMAERLY